MTRECGTCSLCCKLPRIRELEKPLDQWCAHCRPGKGGCTIYATRPAECRDFACLWLLGFMGEEWFPAKSKMILTADGDRLLVMVDPGSPQAWRREPYHSRLCSIAREAIVEIRVGAAWSLLSPNSSTQTVRLTPAEIEARAAVE